MKALSLWEPWASLFRVGAKMHETRGWWTSYRGPLLICASKRIIGCGDWLNSAEYLEALDPLCRDDSRTITNEDLVPTLGHALCLVDLVDCVATQNLPRPIPDFHFGDFSRGRYAFVTANTRELIDPIPITGRQGLFNVSADVERRVNEQLAVLERTTV